MNANFYELANTKEILCLHVGQAGCQIANSLWKTFCQEHAVDCSGYPLQDDSYETNRCVLFCKSKNRYQARALFIDTEPTVIDEVKQGPYRTLFESKMFFQKSGEDSGSVFARGYFQIGNKYFDKVTDNIRFLIEKCDQPSSIMCNRALGGGTGSGLGSKILDHLGDEYSKIHRLEFNICASNHMGTSPLEPYNSLLGLESSCNVGDMTNLIDNEALYKRIRKTAEVSSCTYSKMNSICSSAISGVFSSTRFPGAINVDIVTLLTNLIPYPRIHFPIMNYSSWHESGIKRLYEVTPIEYENRSCLFSKSCLLNLCPLEGKYVSCCMLYRGAFSSGEIAKDLNTLKLKNELSFVDWAPSTFKVCHSFVPPSGSISYSPKDDVSLTILSNNSELAGFLRMQCYRFIGLFRKRAFIHWYMGDGLEMDDFKHALDNIKTLELDYKELNQSLFPAEMIRQRSKSIIEASVQNIMLQSQFRSKSKKSLKKDIMYDFLQNISSSKMHHTLISENSVNLDDTWSLNK